MSDEKSKYYTAEEVAVAVLKKAEEMIAKSNLAKANSTHEVEVGEEPNNDEAECPAYLAEADIESGSSTGKHGEAKSSGIESEDGEELDEEGNPKKKEAIISGVDSDDDGDIDVISEDVDGDGDTDVTTEDSDNDGIADTVSEDVDGDGSADITTEDVDGDGSADVISEDVDGDGETDITAVKAKKKDKKEERPFQKAEKLNRFMKMKKMKKESSCDMKKMKKEMKIEKFLGVGDKEKAMAAKPEAPKQEAVEGKTLKQPSIPSPKITNSGY